ncbi:MAG: coproporphyrinogen III oxidase, partial [Hallella bergensis]
IAIRPERLVTFSYGHVPWVFKRQQILEKIGLPPTDEKRRMFDEASRLLHEAGYRSIGLDHFVLPNDELFTALQEGLLYRNFQGYCTRRTTGQVYAFGATGISQLDTFYAQNTKDIEGYIRDTMSGRLSTAKGYHLTPQQRICKEVIERLMCNYRIRWSELADTLAVDHDTLFSAIHYDPAQLQDMARDGIINLSNDGIVMTDLGHPFVRNVAAALDPLMQHTDKKFSKPI